jgi:hypothetical protein
MVEKGKEMEEGAQGPVFPGFPEESTAIEDGIYYLQLAER